MLPHPRSGCDPWFAHHCSKPLDSINKSNMTSKLVSSISLLRTFTGGMNIKPRTPSPHVTLRCISTDPSVGGLWRELLESYYERSFNLSSMSAYKEDLQRMEPQSSTGNGAFKAYFRRFKGKNAKMGYARREKYMPIRCSGDTKRIQHNGWGDALGRGYWRKRK